MEFTRNQAKELCDRAEFSLFDDAQAKNLNQLTLVELRDRVTRSRTLRDKWRDVARKQKRASQSRKGHRQTADNARSAEKALLFSQVHDAFTTRLEAAESAQAQVARGEKEKSVPRKDRKIVTRAVRSIVRGELENVRGELTKSTVKQGKATTKAKAKKKPATKPAKVAGQQAVKASSTRSTGKKSKTTSSSSEKMENRPPNKTKASKTSKKKSPTISKSRKKALAKRDAASAQGSGPPSSSKPMMEGFGSTTKTPTKAQTAAENRKPRAVATKNRVTSGGGKRLTAHIAAVNRRSQARRDTKG